MDTTVSRSFLLQKCIGFDFSSGKLLKIAVAIIIVIGGVAMASCGIGGLYGHLHLQFNDCLKLIIIGVSSISFAFLLTYLIKSHPVQNSNDQTPKAQLPKNATIDEKQVIDYKVQSKIKKFLKEYLCLNPYDFYDEITACTPDVSQEIKIDKAFCKLGTCPCNKMTKPMRIWLEDHCIEMLAQHPKNAPITIVSVGPGLAYPEVVYLFKLSQKGFTSISLILIETGWVFLDAIFEICQFFSISAQIYKYNSIEYYIQDTLKNYAMLAPHLLLLTDLDDPQFYINNTPLTDFAFGALRKDNIIQTGCVIGYSKLRHDAQLNFFYPQTIACRYAQEDALDIIADRVSFIAAL